MMGIMPVFFDSMLSRLAVVDNSDSFPGIKFGVLVI